MTAFIPEIGMRRCDSINWPSMSLRMAVRTLEPATSIKVPLCRAIRPMVQPYMMFLTSLGSIWTVRNMSMPMRATYPTPTMRAFFQPPRSRNCTQAMALSTPSPIG